MVWNLGGYTNQSDKSIGTSTLHYEECSDFSLTNLPIDAPKQKISKHFNEEKEKFYR